MQWHGVKSVQEVLQKVLVMVGIEGLSGSGCLTALFYDNIRELTLPHYPHPSKIKKLHRWTWSPFSLDILQN